MNAPRMSVISTKSTYSEGGTTALFNLDELNTHTPLRLIKKRVEIDPQRPPIQANIFQRLCFYQYQVNSVSKSEFHGSHPRILKSWMLIWVSTTLTLGTVGWFFVLAFLGQFAKEQHFYVNKMVPLGCGKLFQLIPMAKRGSGMIWVYYFFALVDLSRFLDVNMAFLDHFVNGIYYKNPWNRCSSILIDVSSKTINGTDFEYECLNYEAFRNVVLNSGSTDFKITLFGTFSCYILNKYDKCIQISQTVYLEARDRALLRLETFSDVFCCFILLAGCLLAFKQIYKILIWKALFYADILNCLVYSMVIAYIYYVPAASKKKTIYDMDVVTDDVIYGIKDLCSLLCACYTFSPPSIHFLVSRSKNVNPAQESFAIAFSVVIHSFFFTLTNYSVRTYAIDLMGGLDIGTVFTFPRQYNIMDIWLVYFASMPAGNVLTLLFVTALLMMEYISMVLTFHCLIEMYAAEFQAVKHWVIISVTMGGLAVLYVFLHDERTVLQMYGRISVLVLEMFFIYILYSLERLMDDIQFFYGVSPSKMRYMSIIASIIMELVVLILFFWYVDIDNVSHFLGEEKEEYWLVPYLLILFVAIPLFCCAINAALNIYFKQKDWNLMFVPHDLWGPSAYYPRQLRKQFQSKKYIASQAPRVLSRYLLKNSEPDKYKLDIVYDFSNLWRLIEQNRKRSG